MIDRSDWNGVGSHQDFLAHTRPGYKPLTPDEAMRAADTRDPVVALLETIVQQNGVIISLLQPSGPAPSVALLSAPADTPAKT